MWNAIHNFLTRLNEPLTSLITQESTAPRRPMILKSDRGESSKDQAKDKLEKEKQPTIILKTREQSAPKEDRPQSPKSIKTSTSESDGHPSIHKIAQNENKEKKSTGNGIIYSLLMNIFLFQLFRSAFQDNSKPNSLHVSLLVGPFPQPHWQDQENKMYFCVTDIISF